MQCKLCVALQLKVSHHFIERFAGERTRRLEPPATFGATKTPKTLLLNPYQLPAHGRLCRCAPSWPTALPSTRLPSRDKTFSFRSSVLKTVPSLGVAEDAKKDEWSLHAPIWMVCRASYIDRRFWFVRPFSGPRLKQRNRLKWWSHVSCVTMLARSKR